MFLTACGGEAQIATEAPPATERPDPTARPTATLVAAAPTARPRPTATPELIRTGDIPPSPGSKSYVEGEDTLIDITIDSLETEFTDQGIENVAIDTFTYYITEESLSEIGDFYTDSMPDYGWVFKNDEVNEFGQIWSFWSEDETQLAILTALDMSTVDERFTKKLLPLPKVNIPIQQTTAQIIFRKFK